jgi:hypothetical protein
MVGFSPAFNVCYVNYAWTNPIQVMLAFWAPSISTSKLLSGFTGQLR